MTVVLLNIQRTYFGDIDTSQSLFKAYPLQHNVKALCWDTQNETS